jgi:hypothetical protein
MPRWQSQLEAVGLDSDWVHALICEEHPVFLNLALDLSLTLVQYVLKSWVERIACTPGSYMLNTDIFWKAREVGGIGDIDLEVQPTLSS